jgi:2-iminobutanoate/2-iminopropanoate deaminase
MHKTLINPPGQSAPRGAYSHGLKIELAGAAMLFVTGQLAIDAAGRAVAPGDVSAQTEFVFQLIGKILAEAGMGFADVVRAQTYLTDMADFEKFSVVRNRYFGESRPASTLLEVKGLAKQECVVEIEVTAMK